jgi:hypothetical protein
MSPLLMASSVSGVGDTMTVLRTTVAEPLVYVAIHELGYSETVMTCATAASGSAARAAKRMVQDGEFLSGEAATKPGVWWNSRSERTVGECRANERL